MSRQSEGTVEKRGWTTLRNALKSADPGVDLIKSISDLIGKTIKLHGFEPVTMIWWTRFAEEVVRVCLTL